MSSSCILLRFTDGSGQAEKITPQAPMRPTTNGGFGASPGGHVRKLYQPEPLKKETQEQLVPQKPRQVPKNGESKCLIEPLPWTREDLVRQSRQRKRGSGRLKTILIPTNPKSIPPKSVDKNTMRR